MRLPVTALALSLLTLSSMANGREPPALVRFSGAIGVDPLTAAGGADTLNVVRGISPGGRAWTLRTLEARIGVDGSISARGRGLLFTSGEVIGTRGPVAAVVATLACGAADASASLFTSPTAALDAAGNFQIRGLLSQDGVNAAVMPAGCANPVLLIRGVNAATGAAGGWFAAGIVDVSDD